MTKSGITRFSTKKICCLTKTKNIVGELFCASKIFWFRDFSSIRWVEGGEVGSITYSVECFSLTVAEKLLEEPFSVSLIWSIDNYNSQEGFVTIFCQKLLSHSAEEFRRGVHLCFKIFSISKEVRYKKGGGYHVNPSNFLSHSTEYIRRGTMLFSKKYRLTINFMRKSGISGFSKESLLCRSTKKLRRATVLCIHKVSGIGKTHG